MGRSYNTVRALGIAVMGIAGLVGWTDGQSGVGFFAIWTLVAAVHAGYLRTNSKNPLVPLLIDTTILGGLGLIAGYSGGLQGAGAVYVVAAAVLLLPIARAAWVFLYAAAWSVPLLVIEPVGAIDNPALLDAAVVAAAVLIVARLLYATGRALFAAEGRHRDALEAEKRAVELKDEFVSMVSHELRTPLTSIGGFVDTLRESWTKLPADEVDEFLLIMRGEANHLANLVEDILVIPRLEAGRLRLEPQTIGLRDEAFEVSRLVFAGITRELQVDIPADVYVTADPNRLRQIFRNLLENARKYGGDQVLIAGESTGEQYKIVIVDNGPGIPVEDRDRIFEHFEQAVKGDTRNEGFGLGLPIARKLARAMGGDLWFEPRFPTGAQFLFTVDIATDADRAAVATANVTPMRKTS